MVCQIGKILAGYPIVVFIQKMTISIFVRVGAVAPMLLKKDLGEYLAGKVRAVTVDFPLPLLFGHAVLNLKRRYPFSPAPLVRS